ncbi:unnamed protein product [Arctia plantaginis]|uniref:Uncharacterized protein n=1 Tax=Arctia plantaginis TaxID=874455 RepID=A0A8S1AGJ6_ARCPL|nr:unnamed protein product [Arctia plantaginis]
MTSSRTSRYWLTLTEDSFLIRSIGCQHIMCQSLALTSSDESREDLTLRSIEVQVGLDAIRQHIIKCGASTSMGSQSPPE